MMRTDLQLRYAVLLFAFILQLHCFRSTTAGNGQQQLTTTQAGGIECYSCSYDVDEQGQVANDSNAWCREDVFNTSQVDRVRCNGKCQISYGTSNATTFYSIRRSCTATYKCQNTCVSHYDVTTCAQCCDGILCNNLLVTSTVPPSQRELECYECSYISSSSSSFEAGIKECGLDVFDGDHPYIDINGCSGRCYTSIVSNKGNIIVGRGCSLNQTLCDRDSVNCCESSLCNSSTSLTFTLHRFAILCLLAAIILPSISRS